MDVKHGCGLPECDDFRVVDTRDDGVAFVMCEGCKGIVGTVTSPRLLKQIESHLAFIEGSLRRRA